MNVTKPDFDYSVDKFLLPTYRISPFSTQDGARNFELVASKNDEIEPSLSFDKSYRSTIFTKQGRDALDLALTTLKLLKSDCITILTTTNSTYVSSCVTDTISRHCNWGRKITKFSKALLVIHEFGKMYQNVVDLRKFNIPIIEDCAYAFPVIFNGYECSGDYLIFSLSKYLVLQQGGLLVSKKNIREETPISKHSVVSKIIFTNSEKDFEKIFEKRKVIEKIFINEVRKIGLEPYFDFNSTECPGAFVVRIEKSEQQLENIKIFLQAREVECSVYYGNNAIYLPCHHRMTEYDVNYLVGLLACSMGAS